MGGGVLVDVVVLAPAVLASRRETTTMGKHGKRRLAASATPWDGIDDDKLGPAQKVVAESHRSIYAFRHERFEGDADFFNGYAREACPRCGSREVAKRGLDSRGVQRYFCAGCRHGFSPQTGTIFEDGKLPIPAWTDYLLQLFSYDSFSSMTREDRRSDTTLPYWNAKLFSVLSGIQDDVVLSGRVWADETYWPVSAKEAVRRPDGKLPRGLSVNQMCIGVGVDDGGRSIYVHEGFGKTSKAKTRAAFGGRIERGSVLVHDMEGAHDAIVSDLDLKSERHNSKLLKGVPDEQNPLQPVNRACFLLKSFLGSHSGFKRASIQGYLDVFYVIANPPENGMEKAALVLDRAMRYPKTLRFRDFYNVKPHFNE